MTSKTKESTTFSQSGDTSQIQQPGKSTSVPWQQTDRWKMPDEAKFEAMLQNSKRLAEEFKAGTAKLNPNRKRVALISPSAHARTRNPRS